jgi:putative flippase GtrA
LFSIAGNLALMKLLVALGHMNYLLANGITITACSVVNFLVSDGFVFAADGTETQSM